MKYSLRHFFGIFLICLCFCSFQAKGEDTPQTITIGVVNSFPSGFYVHIFNPTVDYLKEHMPEYRIKVVELGYQNIEKDVEKFKPDFVVTAASDFLELASSHGAIQLSSLIRKASPTGLCIGLHFIVRPESSIDNLWDAKGRTVAISDERSFDGWLIAQGELISLGLRPSHFFSKIIQTENKDREIGFPSQNRESGYRRIKNLRV